MSYWLVVRSIPDKISARERYARLIELLKETEKPWGIGNVEVKEPDFSEFSATLSLSKYYKRGMLFYAHFRHRDMLGDDSAYDDSIIVEFRARKDFVPLAQSVFSRIVEVFGAYQACVYSDEIRNLDRDRIKGVDYRRQIMRFHPLHFIGEDLSSLALHLTPDQIAAKLSGHVHRVEVIQGGVLLSAGDKPLSVEDAIAFDKNVASIISK